MKKIAIILLFVITVSTSMALNSNYNGYLVYVTVDNAEYNQNTAKIQKNDAYWRVSLSCQYDEEPLPPTRNPATRAPIKMCWRVWYDWATSDMYWLGYWEYVHKNPNKKIVIGYINRTSKTITVYSLAKDGKYIYTMCDDEDHRYLAISDKDDNVLVNTIIEGDYCKLIADNGGVWIFKKENKDPLYFIYQDGLLYCYEQEKRK
jgi:hypothetical protein